MRLLLFLFFLFAPQALAQTGWLFGYEANDGSLPAEIRFVHPSVAWVRSASCSALLSFDFTKSFFEGIHDRLIFGTTSFPLAPNYVCEAGYQELASLHCNSSCAAAQAGDGSDAVSNRKEIDVKIGRAKIGRAQAAHADKRRAIGIENIGNLVSNT